MIHLLGDGSKHSPDEFVGRTIRDAHITDSRLYLNFENGVTIKVFDEGQSCCESRYMTTDDDLSKIVGGSLLNIEAKDGPTETGEYGDEHETCFIEVSTDKGFVTLTNHNEHNGYYGGFRLTIHIDEAH